MEDSPGSRCRHCGTWLNAIGMLRRGRHVAAAAAAAAWPMAALSMLPISCGLICSCADFMF